MPYNIWPTGASWPGTSNWPIAGPPLTSLILWQDGRAAAFSDTGGTAPATAFAGRVRRTDQAAPASGQILAPSDPVRPYRETASLNFQVGGAHNMTAAVTPACTQDAVTIGMSFVMRDNFPGGGQFLLCNGTTLQVLTFSNNIITVKYNGGTNWFVAPAASPTSYALASLGSQVSIVVRTTPAGLAAAVVIDGVRNDYTFAASIANTALPGAAWYLGWDGASVGAELHGSCSQTLVYSRSVSDAEATQLLGWLTANPAPRAPSDIPLVMVTGDSIARGFLLEANRSAIWAFLAQVGLNGTQPVNMIDAAISGAGIQNQRDAYPVTMAPFYSPSRARNIFVGAIGTNDMATLSHDGPTTLADYYSYMDMAKAAGWRITPCTVLPRTGTGHDASFETARLYFNSHVLSEAAGRGYGAVADVAAIPQMANPADTTYYLDAIHPTFAGDALMAPVYQAAIQSNM